MNVQIRRKRISHRYSIPLLTHVYKILHTIGQVVSLALKSMAFLPPLTSAEEEHPNDDARERQLLQQQRVFDVFVVFRDRSLRICGSLLLFDAFVDLV